MVLRTWCTTAGGASSSAAPRPAPPAPHEGTSAAGLSAFAASPAFPAGGPTPTGCGRACGVAGSEPSAASASSSRPFLVGGDVGVAPPSHVASDSQVETEWRCEEEAAVEMELVEADEARAAVEEMMWPTMRCSSEKSRATLTWYSMLQVAITYSHRENQLNAAREEALEAAFEICSFYIYLWV